MKKWCWPGVFLILWALALDSFLCFLIIRFKKIYIFFLYFMTEIKDLQNIVLVVLERERQTYEQMGRQAWMDGWTDIDRPGMR